MKNFIEVTVADGCKALVPISNIEYVAELYDYNCKVVIYFIAGNRNGFTVRESMTEIAAKIEAATGE